MSLVAEGDSSSMGVGYDGGICSSTVELHDGGNSSGTSSSMVHKHK
jgi:hypothetical protein